MNHVRWVVLAPLASSVRTCLVFAVFEVAPADCVDSACKLATALADDDGQVSPQLHAQRLELRDEFVEREPTHCLSQSRSAVCTSGALTPRLGSHAMS
jgi:hypothetical protein